MEFDLVRIIDLVGACIPLQSGHHVTRGAVSIGIQALIIEMAYNQLQPLKY